MPSATRSATPTALSPSSSAASAYTSTFEGDTVWEGEVLIFDLLGNQLATRCYAWEKDGKVTAVLHTGPIDSPLRAVQASILAVLESEERSG